MQENVGSVTEEQYVVACKKHFGMIRGFMVQPELGDTKQIVSEVQTIPRTQSQKFDMDVCVKQQLDAVENALVKRPLPPGITPIFFGDDKVCT